METITKVLLTISFGVLEGALIRLLIRGISEGASASLLVPVALLIIIMLALFLFGMWPRKRAYDE